jgi:hypothetical protein
MINDAREAKQIFEDTANYITPQSDPVMWNITSGLFRMSQAIENYKFAFPRNGVIYVRSIQSWGCCETKIGRS